MKKSLRIVACFLSLALLLTPFAGAAAQSSTLPLVRLTSKDSAHPVLFQILAPEEVASVGALASPVSVEPDTAVKVYVSFQNDGGWSSGVIGLLSPVLFRENKYVALEVDQDGVLVENGQAFELGYRAGYFLLAAQLDRPRSFAIFQIVESDGITVAAQTPTVTGNSAAQNPVEYMIDAESPFGSVILECHIAPR